jgi:hypothetical protein
MVDNPIYTSDRRLKKNIVPLKTAMTERGPISWHLRELRPVSFQFKDSKGMGRQEADRHRFGFIAQVLLIASI